VYRCDGAEAVRLSGLPPAGAAEPAILVLGSFPSVRSLELRRYYSHPRNHFWPIVAALAGVRLPDGYGERLALLERLGMALWDVIGACVRPGSLDGDIRDAAANDVAGFVLARPSILRVALNGTMAADRFTRTAAPDLRGAFGRVGEPVAWRPDPASPRVVTVARMPSTSPVPSGRYRCMEDKLPAWLGFLGRA